MADYSSTRRSIPCAKRACVALDSIHLSQVAQMQIRGQEQKKPTEVLDRETGQGEVDLLQGRIEQILYQAAKNAGLTKTRYI